MIKSAVAKVLTVKVMAILGATAAGGVALAATTGALPNPLTGTSHGVSSGLSSAHPDASESGAARSAEAKASKGADDSDAKGPDASHAPSPSLVGLCHAYNAGNKTEQGKALENPAFTVLVTTAGGKDKVAQYCTTVLASAAPSADHSDAADGSKSADEHATSRPSNAPNEHAVRPSASAKH